LRILRLTLDAAMTNQQLAQRLGISPASALYHVRRLVSAGLLEALPSRPRASGGFEIPYQSNRRSWTINVPAGERPTAAVLGAFLAELEEVGPERVEDAIRMRPVLTAERHAELLRRLRELLDEYATDDPGGTPWSLFIALHRDDRQADGRPAKQG
jgi:predicted ArsR family transcriptional regulator